MHNVEWPITWAVVRIPRPCAIDGATLHDWSHNHMRPVSDLLRFEILGLEFWTIDLTATNFFLQITHDFYDHSHDISTIYPRFWNWKTCWNNKQGTFGKIDPSVCLSNFTTATEEEISKSTKPSATQSCHLDPIQTWLLKLCLFDLLPVIINIVHTSLLSSEVPWQLKLARVRPLLKKGMLDPKI